MNFILQCAAGCLCVGVPFFLAYDPYDLWNSVIAGLAGGIVYLAAVFIMSVKQFDSKKETFLIGTVCVLLAGGYTVLTVTQYRMSHYQHELLLKIRTAIGSGVIASDKIPETMLPVLRAYYQPPPAHRGSLVAVFRKMYGEEIEKGTFNRYRHGVVEADAVTIVSFNGDSVVNYVCIDTVAGGWKSDFHNATGHTGKLQYRASLSGKGVHYERVN